MITIITGQPGNGKTLKAIDLMRIEYDRNMAAVKAGKEQPRRFFSNVKGATTEENPNAFPWVERMPDHNDWTKLPHGSFVQMDEAHSDGTTPGLERYGNLFPSTGKPGESSDHRIRAMSTHRSSFSMDLQLVTQWPSKVHHQVRTLAGQHVHMSRAFGMERAGVLVWNRVQNDPYDDTQREKAEETIWVYPKDLYSRYHSATLHTAMHKFKMPPAIWKGLSVLIATLLIGWAFLSWVNARSEKKVGEIKATAAQGQGRAAPAAPPLPSDMDPASYPGTGRYEPLRAPPTPKITGYLDTPRGCRMWDDQGQQLDISNDDCRAMIEQGVPLHYLATERGRDDRPGEGQRPSGMGASAPAPAQPPTQGGSAQQVASYGQFRTGS